MRRWLSRVPAARGIFEIADQRPLPEQYSYSLRASPELDSGARVSIVIYFAFPVRLKNTRAVHLDQPAFHLCVTKGRQLVIYGQFSGGNFSDSSSPRKQGTSLSCSQ